MISQQVQIAVDAAANAAMGEPAAKQFWLNLYGHRDGADISGEKRLMLEFLEHARRDLAKPVGSRVFRDAARWVEERDPDRPFSFEWVCDALGWEPGGIRSALLSRQNGYDRKVWRRLAEKKIVGRRER